MASGQYTSEEHFSGFYTFFLLNSVPPNVWHIFWLSLLKENERMTKFCCKRYEHVLFLFYEDKNSQIMFRWLDNMLHKEKLKFFLKAGSILLHILLDSICKIIIGLFLLLCYSKHSLEGPLSFFSRNKIKSLWGHM